MSKLLYISNQYPSPSLTFIRREIAALEELGFSVERVAIRGWEDKLVDPLDHAERARTHYLLRGGALKLLTALIATALSQPRAFVRALLLAFSLMRRSYRPAPLHLVWLAQACVAQRLCRATGVKHIHAHFGTNSAEVAMLTGRLAGIPFSFTVHGPDEFDHPEYIALREKTAAAAFVATISSFTRSQMLRWVDFADWDKVKTVPCGLDRSYIDAGTDEPADGERKAFVCIARLSPQKGQVLLIDAVAEVARHHPDVHLRLIGDGELRPVLEARIAALGISENVTLVGWLSSDAVRQEIRQARALVLSSFGEGLPIVIMEAMAMRRPVLSTWVAGIPELVRDGIDGWTYPAGSAPAIAEAMRACLDASDQALEKMGGGARARCVARHDARVGARMLADHFTTSIQAASIETASMQAGSIQAGAAA